MRWDVGLNKKHLASFTFARDDASELRLMTGALLVDMLLPDACIWLTGCHCGQKQQLLGACMMQAASFLLQISSKCSRGCLPQLDSALSSCATSAQEMSFSCDTPARGPTSSRTAPTASLCAWQMPARRSPWKCGAARYTPTGQTGLTPAQQVPSCVTLIDTCWRAGPHSDNGGLDGGVHLEERAL